MTKLHKLGRIQLVGFFSTLISVHHISGGRQPQIGVFANTWFCVSSMIINLSECWWLDDQILLSLVSI